MRVTTFPASADLSRYVRGFRVVETLEPAERVLLPEPCVLLGFRYSGAAFVGGSGLPGETLTGLRDSARHVQTSAKGGLIIAVFRELGANALLKQPVHELFRQTVPLDALFERGEVARTSDAVKGAASHEARVRAVELFLRRAFQRGPQPDALIGAAVSRIIRTHGAQHIGALAASLDVSRDRFEKRFRRAVGITPRKFASLMRFHQALRLAPSAPTLARLSVDAGYFDQPHLIREFRAFAGEPPSRFFGNPKFC